MKVIHQTFEDIEHEEISKLKDKTGLNWHDFILYLCDFYNKHNSGVNEDGS